MRTLAIGDIHGCHIALTCLLQQVQPSAEDRIIFLGDYIDRGPASREVVETLLGLKKECSTVFLRGNHEEMLLAARKNAGEARLWRMSGGLETVVSYGAASESDGLNCIPASHWVFFILTQPYFETKSHLFVHASLDPDADMDKQENFLLFWARVEGLRPHKSGKRILCGHSAQYSGEILNLGFALCIDTAAVFGGWLTCVDVESGQWWQTNEKRETRQGRLSSWQ
jgi:serine/threonine protein phosphatase 1